jgi:hypothetical protein
MSDNPKYNGPKLVEIDKACVVSTFRRALKRIRSIKNVIIIMEYDEYNEDGYRRGALSTYSDRKAEEFALESYNKAR